MYVHLNWRAPALAWGRACPADGTAVALALQPFTAANQQSTTSCWTVCGAHLLCAACQACPCTEHRQQSGNSSASLSLMPHTHLPYNKLVSAIWEATTSSVIRAVASSLHCSARLGPAQLGRTLRHSRAPAPCTWGHWAAAAPEGSFSHYAAIMGSSRGW